ncbi:MAG TPA: hypothetical protein VK576_00740 [Thermoleophilia bacterium]|nr:hypothetical protein [Thermoleophilia bacterium]
MGSVSVSSTYPLEVLWKGRSLAKVQDSARVSLPQGRQTLTLVAAPVFLRASVGVDVKEGEARVEAPALGRLNIRANPDNCEVFVDGFSAGYLPILDHPVAAGSHSVAFKWPDGSHDEQSVDVTAGRPAYVMGRKE